MDGQAIYIQERFKKEAAALSCSLKKSEPRFFFYSQIAPSVSN
jgi:hypothetical protein